MMPMEHDGDGDGDGVQNDDHNDHRRRDAPTTDDEAVLDVPVRALADRLDSSLDALMEGIRDIVARKDVKDDGGGNNGANDNIFTAGGGNDADRGGDKDTSADAATTSSSSGPGPSPSPSRRLLSVASTAHGALWRYGRVVEMGLVSGTADDGKDRLTPERRERLRDVGRNVWMAVRSNPTAFRDHVSPPKSTTAAAVASSSAAGGAEDGGDDESVRAAAGGYVRSIAARLILVDHIRTRERIFPTVSALAQGTAGPSTTTTTTTNAELSDREAEFGIRSLSRAGRAILSNHSHLGAAAVAERDGLDEDPAMAAYSTLSLAVKFWEVLSSRANEGGGDGTAVGVGSGEAREMADGNVEDAFDALALLPDAASLVVCRRPPGLGEGSSPSSSPVRKKHRNLGGGGDDGGEEATTDPSATSPSSADDSSFGTPAHIVELLHRLDRFVENGRTAEEEKDGGGGTKGKNNNPVFSNLRMQRFLPCLARVSYKHGNRFARVGDHVHAKRSLHVALSSTDRCLAEIRSCMAVATTTTSDRSNKAAGSGCGTTATTTPLQVQEREMLVVSKECLYVLAHVCRATGKTADAHKCLNRIERYVEEQRRKDDELFSETMRRIGGGGGGVEQGRGSGTGASSSFPSVSSSDLALVGPKEQDKADIKARAQTARARGRQAEARELANLAFCRVMVHDRGGSPSPTVKPSSEDEDAIDRQLRVLVDLSAKFSGVVGGGATDSGGGEVVSCSLPPVATAANAVAADRSDRFGVSAAGPAERSDDAVFELALGATRLVAVRRLTSTTLGAAAADDDDDATTAYRGDPYEVLLSFYKSGHPKNLLVSLDRLNAILTSVQSVRERGNSHLVGNTNAGDSVGPTLETAIGSLDNTGLKAAKVLFKEVQQQLTNRKDARESTLILPEANLSRDPRMLHLLREARVHFSRAVSLYRALDNEHRLCAEWSDLLVRVLVSLSEVDKNSADASSKKHRTKETEEEMNQVIAEVMSVKAYSLTMSGDHQTGISCARQAWKRSLERPSVRVLTALFHCGLLRELDTLASDASSSSSTSDRKSCDSLLLELDDASSHLLSSYDAGTAANEILEVFPLLSNSCACHGGSFGENVLLSVQERWMIMLLNSESIAKSVLRAHGRGQCTKEGADAMNVAGERSDTATPPGDLSLLSILRSYLCNFERLLGKYRYMAEDDSSWFLHASASVDRTLSAVLRFLVQVRDRRLSTPESNVRSATKHRRRKKKEPNDGNEHSASGNGENASPTYKLVWDDNMTQSCVGQHRDCVWVAEQVWNLAVQISQSATGSKSGWISAQLFANAHDFALLSEEEEGLALSRGHLDGDHKLRTSYDEDIELPRFANVQESDNNMACDLSSEFSAQSLLLSVANAVDTASHDSLGDTKDATDGCSVSRGTVRQNLTRSLARLKQAQAEFNINRTEENSSEREKSLDGILAWLALRCMVEIGEDGVCIASLGDGGLMEVLCEAPIKNDDHNSNSSSTSGKSMVEDLDTAAESVMDGESPPVDECDNRAHQSRTASLSNHSTMVHIYLCSQRAEANGMPGTAKILLLYCARELMKSHLDGIKVEAGIVHSLGEIQKKIIKISQTVEESIDIFEDVSKFMSSSSHRSNDTTSEERTSCDSQLLSRYSQQDIDWFTIEAYNRGVNLAFLGDVSNAERLLGIALNLLPGCGNEVTCHGAEMRLAYRGAVERKGMMGGPVSASSSMMQLFGGVVPTGGVAGGAGAGAGAAGSFLANPRALFG